MDSKDGAMMSRELGATPWMIGAGGVSGSAGTSVQRRKLLSWMPREKVGKNAERCAV